MKYTTIAMMLLGLWPVAVLAEAPQVLESDNAKINYSLGYELGKDLKREQVELVPEAMMQGVEDALEGNQALIGRTQRRQALGKIKENRAREQFETSQAYLERNADNEGVTVRESGLQYKVIEAGEGKTPKATDTVVVHYRGRLIDGTEFDSSQKQGKPASFQVNRVIKGWQEALQLMQEGARWELYIPPQLAYGKRGRPPVIPPNSALIFEVALISVE